MKFLQKMSLLLVCLLPLLGFSQSCAPNEKMLIVALQTDNYPAETRWELVNSFGQILQTKSYAGLSNVTLYKDTICIPNDQCIQFKIYDQAGDGICCGYGQGFYDLILNGDTVAHGGSYGTGETHYLSCPQGSFCSNPLVADTNQFYTANLTNSPSLWYAFTPAVTGQYSISTCSPNTTCNTTIWVYDNCTNLHWDSTVQGTYIFSDSGCLINPLLAYATTVFQQGVTYYIRIGSSTNSCLSIDWKLNYLGPVVGCMDQNSCNYNPLATVAGACYYYGDPQCPQQPHPDLVVNQTSLRSTIQSAVTNNQDQCLIAEGCVKGYGQRQLVRFDTRIENIGNQDYYLGQPPALGSPNTPQWKFDPCHGHWHYVGYAEYVLYDMNNNEIPAGFKNGFCVLDLDCPSSIPGQYSCGNQGITAGCADIYNSGLQCQWIDITSVPDGQYTLVVRVNWNGNPDVLNHYEASLTNNWADACIQIRTVNNQREVDVVTGCTPYMDCLGVQYGKAKPDCEGTCNGSKLMGDLNTDTLRNLPDFQNYIQKALSNTALATPCNDLNADHKITVTDAALLWNCMYHTENSNLPQPLHQACQFPQDVNNPFDSVTLSLGTINTMEHYVDVNIQNPSAKINALQFKLNGIRIQQVNSLLPEYLPILNYDITGELTSVGTTTHYNLIDRHSNFVPAFRIYFDSLAVNTEICLESITATVNKDLEETKHAIGLACLNFTGINSFDILGLNPRVEPNPFDETAFLKFNNPNHLPYTITIIDPTGRSIIHYQSITEDHIRLEKSKLSTGLYFYTISNGSGSYTNKFLVQ